MNRRTVTALAVTVVALAACTPDLIQRGIVTGGEHHEQWIEMLPLTTCSGNPSICTTNYVPIVHPETWTLKLDDGSRKGQRDVSEQGYSRCLIGETWPDCEAAE
ncbi:hypothetical protein [Mycobacteroides abscessus]|uniref:hypothetical protein n=1 Tax=Mycobacteroides abscessus TaxID=36809 RepID=UPI0003631640|nr:hypothetical protein [Mycobacteroides abscessus]RIQ99269.1 hypothetical protein D2E40_17015 [Mycobacteroides abscessus]SKI82647.1 Uncharacterised protein [Mycobacteroides abscessus subsp. massiliense]SKR77771.1 Uncharacterised protein [Mycobacteroides abscessus subsp. massiliense]SKS39669.1 Uncharacterised protein [Mycobacteroides abscessus subsp. massiliense]SKS90082.1 Uncharacterised protein [Mycobacteroides abscessus subsp. massiliense]